MRRTGRYWVVAALALLGGCAGGSDSAGGSETLSRRTSALTANGTPRVRITRTDTRPLSNLRVTANFTIAGAPYSDWEDVGTFDQTINLGLNGRSGTLQGGTNVGNLLYPQTANAGAAVLYVNQTDDRTIKTCQSATASADSPSSFPRPWRTAGSTWPRFRIRSSSTGS